MPKSISGIREKLHYRVHAHELAKWLETQGKNSWWTVDGDPFLTERVSFPCLSEDLAEALRRLNKTLWLLGAEERKESQSDTLTSEMIGQLAYTDKNNDRAFQLCWEDKPDIDWLLIEDKEIGEIAYESDEAGKS